MTLTYRHINLSDTAYVTLTDGYIMFSDYLNYTKGYIIEATYCSV